MEHEHASAKGGKENRKGEGRGRRGGRETQVDTPRFLHLPVNGHQPTVPTLALRDEPLCPPRHESLCRRVFRPQEPVTRSRTAGARGTTARHPLLSPESQAIELPEPLCPHSPNEPNLLIPPELEKVLLPEAAPSAQSGLAKTNLLLKVRVIFVMEYYPNHPSTSGELPVL